MDKSAKGEDFCQPTMYKNIIFKNLKYVATGVDPHWDMPMHNRLE